MNSLSDNEQAQTIRPDMPECTCKYFDGDNRACPAHGSKANSKGGRG